jgi:hypothetical protein
MSYKKLLLLTLTIPLFLHTRANNAGAGIEGKIEGILHGYVMDAVTKRPLPGVTVSAIMPGTNNSKEVTTDSDGYFRFVQLPGAQVTVQFDKKGYLPAKRPGVIIKERTSVTLNVECVPDDMDTDASAEYPLLRLMQAG